MGWWTSSAASAPGEAMETKAGQSSYPRRHRALRSRCAPRLVDTAHAFQRDKDCDDIATRRLPSLICFEMILVPERPRLRDVSDVGAPMKAQRTNFALNFACVRFSELD